MIGWTQKEIFTKDFLKLDYHHISDEIKSDTMHCQKFSELYLE